MSDEDGATAQRVFFGRVLPERADVSITPPLSFRFGSDPAQLAEAVISIDASQVTVRVTGDGGHDLVTLKNAVRSAVAVLVDTLGFVKAIGYQVEITGSDGPEGQAVYGVDFAGLAGDGDLTFQMLFQAQLADLDPGRANLRRALADYRRAILEPDDTPFHTFRAVEGLAYAFGRNPDAGTPKMCAALNLDRRWLKQTLERPASEVRHGKSVTVSHQQRRTGLRAARVVIQRYAEWMLRERQSLPLDQFPLLTPEQPRP